MVRDVFGTAHIKLRGTDTSPIYINPAHVEGILGTEVGSELWLVVNGCARPVYCEEKPEEVINMINELADRQDKFHKELEEEAKEKATERFFDKFPKAKAAYLAEVEEQKKCSEGKAE